MEEEHKKVPCCICLKLEWKHGPFLQGIQWKRIDYIPFSTFWFCTTMIQSNLKSLSELICWSPSKEFQIDISKCSSRNDYVLGQDLTRSYDKWFRIINIFLPQRSKKFVRISEKFELTNFELSDGFYRYLIANVHGTEIFIGSSN